MSKILFSKFSNERGAEFNIRTDIVEDDAGRRYVEKVPYSVEAEGHVDRMEKWYHIFEKQYEGTRFRANRCEKDGKKLRFEYLDGRTFESLLDEYGKEDDGKKILNLLYDYQKELDEAYPEEPFVMTETFKTVFGAVDIPTGTKASRNINIDLIFQNLILCDEKWNVIDYEWTFDFLIPVNFVLYRALFYYSHEHAEREILKGDHIYRLFGITKKEMDTYRLMEENFQKYIRSGYQPLSLLYSYAGKNVISLSEIEKKCHEERPSVQVYFDSGEGFTEEHSQRFAVDKGNALEVEISLPEKTKNIRFDPDDRECLVNVKSIWAFNGSWYELSVAGSNALKIDNSDIYIFETKDPGFVIGEMRENTTSLRFSYEIVYLPYHISQYLSDDIMKRKDELEQAVMHCEQLEQAMAHCEQVNADYKNRLEAKESEAELWKNQCDIMVNSFLWRMTEPLRKTAAVLKKSFHKNHSDQLQEQKQQDEEERERKEKEFKERADAAISESRSFFLEDREQENDNIILEKNIKFSILFPVYNMEAQCLYETIQLLIDQNYAEWELCIMDASDKEHTYVKQICEWYAQKEGRIKYASMSSGLNLSEIYQKCFEMASGDYVGVLNQNDILHPSVLYEYSEVLKERKAVGIYCDEDLFEEKLIDAHEALYKPDYAPDFLTSYNYIGQFCVLRRDYMLKAGGFESQYADSQMYDMLFKVLELSDELIHIPEIYYYRRKEENELSQELQKIREIDETNQAVILEHMKRCGYSGTVGKIKDEHPMYRVKYCIQGEPLITILIPNKDHVEDLMDCLQSIQEKSTYRNYEIIIIENNSTKAVTFAYYKKLSEETNVKVVEWKGEFNYSAINNFGLQYAKGDYILFLNNDMEIITPEWMEELLMYVQQERVGAAGAMLYYPDDTIQHAGVILGIGGVAGHSHKYFKRGAQGYMGRLKTVQNLTAVTAACMLTKKSVLEQVQGLDEKYKVAFNDVDLCMKIREAGYMIVFTPFAELYHYESKSRGMEDSPEKIKRFESETERFQTKWKMQLETGDAFYNVNLTLETEDFGISQE